MRNVTLYFPAIKMYGNVTITDGAAIFKMNDWTKAHELYMSHVKDKTAEALKIHWDQESKAMVQLFPMKSEAEVLSLIKQELHKAKVKVKEQ